MKDTTERSSAESMPRTIERAFRVLDSFTAETPRWRTTDLARQCGLPTPTVHRILAVLVRLGYVYRDPATREHGLGPSAARFARCTPTPDELRSLALPTLRAVGRAAKATPLLSALSSNRDSGIEVRISEFEAGSEAARGYPRSQVPAQRTRPLHAGASFKSLLAYMRSEEIEGVVDRGLDPIAPGTITEGGRLRIELAAIRRRGWAFSREETRPGSWAVAVPVFDSAGQATCALGIAAPLSRLDRDRARDHLTVLGLAAQRLGPGLSGPSPDRDRSDSVNASAREEAQICQTA